MNMVNYKAKHFNFNMSEGVATISLTGADQKNPLTFESYAELRDVFRDIVYCDDIHVVVFGSNAGNFCSGGNVNDIIGPLVKMNMKELLNCTRMTGDVVKSMINCKKPILASIDGICVGAGAILAMASDIRIATNKAKTAFLFNKVGLAGCDMGACGILPRLIGQGRAAELLYTGRIMTVDEGEAWGFYNKVVSPELLDETVNILAQQIVNGPALGNMMTKTMLAQEWSMSIEQIIESEAQAQAICMQTGDFKRAYEAFIIKQKPKFEGN